MPTIDEKMAQNRQIYLSAWPRGQFDFDIRAHNDNKQSFCNRCDCDIIRWWLIAMLINAAFWLLAFEPSVKFFERILIWLNI